MSAAEAHRAPIPIYDSTAPIACTASSDDIDARIEQIERMRTDLTRVQRTEHGLLLHFPNRPDIDAHVRRFAVDEKRCCTFWGFDITTNDDDELTLRWDGPPDAAEFFEQLVTSLEGDEPREQLIAELRSEGSIPSSSTA